jgi:hypothetical protein
MGCFIGAAGVVGATTAVAAADAMRKKFISWSPDLELTGN